MNLHIHICHIFPVSHDKILNKQKDMQYRKIIGIIKDTDRGIDAVKVIFIFPAYVHADNDKSLLCKCLNFSLSKKNVELLEYL